jgi:uncharacterized protein YcsI (UPF0317 family)
MTTAAEPEPLSVRHAARSGAHASPTAGAAPGFVQANIAIVPRAQAAAFEEYCRANWAPCPLLAVSHPGDPALPALGHDVDIRRDLPRYRVYRDGALAEERTDVAELWRDDLVTFAIGCSFTFERALLRDGIRIRHIDQRRNVPMYRSSIETVPSGPFGGPMVVSMRPIATADVPRAAAITARFPDQHGGPVHAGDPAAIGIADLGRVDYGEAVDVHPGETPVFWACGVTSQAALERARLPFFIAHAPGHMLVTDLRHRDA